ncbi:MAG: polyphosphate kinase 1 [Bacteroidia bacterium]|jgi:polyphosphate kinase|nr:polyphosphate kinase 1 [Bacteroidia bacterium]MBP7245207.1 polyphosphate kinase 1 [Bacteroidia bacterium]
MKSKHFLLVNRDISWLSFNDRVLQEANDPSVPLLERMKFLGIVSNNRDEFFRVRIATIKRMARLGKQGAQIMGEDPVALLNSIQEVIIRQQEEFDNSYGNLLRELELAGIFIVNEKQLKPDQSEFARQFFREQVLPTLVPILLDNVTEFPYLRDRSIYFLVIMHHKNGKERYALVEIPTHILPRFIVIPKENKYIILIDDIIRYSLDDLFFSFEYERISAYTIKLTRDAELDIENDVTKSLIKKVSESVKRRKKGQPVRLIYDEEMPESAITYLMKRIKFGKGDQPIPAGRYHNFVDFIKFPSLNKPELFSKKVQPLSHPELLPKHSVLKVIKEKDILLSFPYQSYHHIIDVLREASMDPKVQSIEITLYRLSEDSHVVNALINSIRNGKQVTVVVELQARFDEENNIKWTNRLNEEGAKVIYGVPGLKMHSKLFLIRRMEHNKEVLYAHIGTGNFNEVTAKLYCDHSLLTADKRITEEVAKVFKFYNDNYKTGTYKHLLVSPFFTRKKLLLFIQTEIDNIKKKKEAWMFLKMNSLTDPELIKKLYEASQAGVKIRMIIRGICSLVPGQKGLSENIEVISIVDKYLEHARVFIFANDNDPRFYLASFDWMTRNIDFRSEVGVPIYDKILQKQLWDIMELQWSDNSKARYIDSSQSNRYKKIDLKNKVRAQDAIYKYLAPKEKLK